MFCDDNGCSARPFIYGVEARALDGDQFPLGDQDRHRGQAAIVEFFVRGDDYRLFGIKSNLHLFGVDKGIIHLFGTDDTGKDIFSRTLHAI